MPHPRKFRFGIQVRAADTAHEWVRLAQEAEALGYATLTMPDHFGAELAPMPALSVAAAVTRTLRVGAMVWCNDYKHPVVLAKEIATLDRLTEGRVELGIGAGWMTSDYAQAGLPYDGHGVRIDRLEEALQVMRGLFAEGPCTFHGKHYRIEGLDGFPKPRQKPHPPILIGGGGKRVLSLAGRVADIVGVNASIPEGVIGPAAVANISAAKTREKVEWVRAAAGPRYADLEMSVTVYQVVVTDDPGPAWERAAEGFGIPVAAVQEIPHLLIGSASQIEDTLQQRRAAYDVSYVVINAAALHTFAPIAARLTGR